MLKLNPIAATALCGTALITATVQAAPIKKTPPKTHPASTPGTKGTHQMAGDDGVFGETYTVTDAGDYGPMNFTIISAEYSVSRFNITDSLSAAPKTGEKLLVVHYRVKNPNTTDLYYSSRPLFQTVTADDQTSDDSGESRREGQKEEIGVQIKPGQGIDDLVTYAVIPAKGLLPKIILRFGRVGTKEEVIRYILGQGQNLIQPIPAPYADPADPTGATALTEIPAALGTSYQMGFYDMTVNAAAFAPGPFGDTTADEGKRFLVVTVTATNKTWGKLYFNQAFSATLTTSDDEKTQDFVILKSKRDETFEGTDAEAGDTLTTRLLFSVPKDVTAKTLKFSEAEDNSGNVSHALVFDLSGVK